MDTTDCKSGFNLDENERKFGLIMDANERKFGLKLEYITDAITLTLSDVVGIPSIIDLRPVAPPIMDQLTLNSCTSMAMMGVVNYYDKNFSGSTLFHYWCERNADGNIYVDDGSTLSQALSVAKTIGICSEKTWPYLPEKYTIKPSAYSFVEAKLHTVLSGSFVTAQSIRACLAKLQPVILGIRVYSSFTSTTVGKTGIVPMPSTSDVYLGGHAVVVYGYNDTTSMLIVRNSWGILWGDKGYFYLPYAYVLDSKLTNSCLLITGVTIPTPICPVCPVALPKPPEPIPEPDPIPEPIINPIIIIRL